MVYVSVVGQDGEWGKVGKERIFAQRKQDQRPRDVKDDKIYRIL